MIAELHDIQHLDVGSVRIGAMVTHAALAEKSDFSASQAIIAKAAQVIAHPAVRNVGTIGGSIVHGDPRGRLSGCPRCR